MHYVRQNGTQRTAKGYFNAVIRWTDTARGTFFEVGALNQ